MTNRRLSRDLPHVTISLCTGRSPSSIKCHVERLDLGVNIPIVCLNGGAAFLDVRTEKAGLAQDPGKAVWTEPLFCNVLDRETILQTLLIVRSIPSFSGAVQCYTPSGIIYTNATTEQQKVFTSRYEHLTGTRQVFLEAESDEDFVDQMASLENAQRSSCLGVLPEGSPSAFRCCKILCFAAEVDVEDSFARLEQSFQSKKEGDRAVTNPNFVRGSPPFFVEVLPPKTNKGTGLLMLCESLKIPISQVLAFGDGDNDGKAKPIIIFLSNLIYSF